MILPRAKLLRRHGRQRRGIGKQQPLLWELWVNVPVAMVPLPKWAVIMIGPSRLRERVTRARQPHA